ncbi:hypothetical protein [Protaetiibacter intestinalis]|uniref:Uncharacterized protein n=1 Tax=Protaetiibacter intestinalis TaxID=2419774 RepID=A0A387B296_9MICO|nr:hypothetical protein [Protaetiibacter intestinalis]AYF97654.1 hypothetical protein D7I47_04855 [Protaetiibacter intestinalis]
MTDSTAPAAETPTEAPAETPAVDETASAPASAEPAKPARRWKTLTLAITAIVALVLGLGVGGVSGWAIANAQRPGFGNGQFPGGGFPNDGQMPDFGDGQGPGNGDMPQPGDGSGSGNS